MGGYQMPPDTNPMRLTQGTTTGEAGSPPTGVTDPDAAAGWPGTTGFPSGSQPGSQNAYGSQIPQYMGFAQAFKQHYPQMTPTAMSAVDDLWESLNHLYSIGDANNNQGWQSVAYSYTYDQFIRDAAVVIAARSGHKSPDETQKQQSKPLKTTVSQPGNPEPKRM
jgi:hypothetical protein